MPHCECWVHLANLKSVMVGICTPWWSANPMKQEVLLALRDTTSGQESSESWKFVFPVFNLSFCLADWCVLLWKKKIYCCCYLDNAHFSLFLNCLLSFEFRTLNFWVQKVSPIPPLQRNPPLFPSSTYIALFNKKIFFKSLTYLEFTRYKKQTWLSDYPLTPIYLFPPVIWDATFITF